MAWVGIPPTSPAPRLCAHLRNPAVHEGFGPVDYAPCPPALLVVYPVFLLRRIRALEPRKARLGAMFALLALPCSGNFLVQ